MRGKLDAEEADFKTEHVFEPPQRSQSAPKLSSPMTQFTLFEEFERETQIPVPVFTHPLHSYQKYLDDYVKTDLEPLRLRYGDNRKTRQF